jgi:hypothetical protein
MVGVGEEEHAAVMNNTEPLSRLTKVGLHSIAPVGALGVAAGVVEALVGDPAAIVETTIVSALYSFVFVAPFAAIAVWASRPGRQRSAVVTTLSLLAAAMGAFLVASTLSDAGQIILFFPPAALALAAASANGLWSVRPGSTLDLPDVTRGLVGPWALSTCKEPQVSGPTRTTCMCGTRD